MHTRENALQEWLKTQMPNSVFTLTPLAGDASFRRYFRLQSDHTTQVVMDAPPDKEGLEPFLNIAKLLTQHEIRTPHVIAAELNQGFMLLEDLGDLLFLSAINNDNADDLYQRAIDILLQIQRCPLTQAKLPAFNEAYILYELSLFRDWFIHAYLALELSQAEARLLDETFTWISLELARQPQVLIHRDFHSRNLMLLDSPALPEIAVIDFQDAMIGPYSYDLVSLLKDCYIQWPRTKITQWTTYFYQHLAPRPNHTLNDFIRAFDLCGIQRHLKVLGIFCRLHLRDHKSHYLNDLPLTLNYLIAGLESYPELHRLLEFVQQRIQPVFWKQQV